MTSGDSGFTFIDREPEPPFKVTVSSLSVEVADLDTAPDGKAGTFKLDGRVGEFSRIGAQGSMVATEAGFDVEFASRGTGLDLMLLTAYLSALQGVEVRSGRADVKLDGSLKADRVDATSDLVISKLELAPRKSGGTPAQGSRPAPGGMPLATALMLLRDDKGTVKLKVPITGSLGDPTFDFSDAVDQAVGIINE